MNFAIEHGISITYIAKKIGIDPSTLNRWIHNKRKVSDKVQIALFDTFKNIKQAWTNINI